MRHATSRKAARYRWAVIRERIYRGDNIDIKPETLGGYGSDSREAYRDRLLEDVDAFLADENAVYDYFIGIFKILETPFDNFTPIIKPPTVTKTEDPENLIAPPEVLPLDEIDPDPVEPEQPDEESNQPQQFESEPEPDDVIAEQEPLELPSEEISQPEQIEPEKADTKTNSESTYLKGASAPEKIAPQKKKKKAAKSQDAFSPVATESIAAEQLARVDALEGRGSDATKKLADLATPIDVPPSKPHDVVAPRVNPSSPTRSPRRARWIIGIVLVLILVIVGSIWIANSNSGGNHPTAQSSSDKPASSTHTATEAPPPSLNTHSAYGIGFSDGVPTPWPGTFPSYPDLVKLLGSDPDSSPENDDNPQAYVPGYLAEILQVDHAGSGFTKATTEQDLVVFSPDGKSLIAKTKLWSGDSDTVSNGPAFSLVGSSRGLFIVTESYSDRARTSQDVSIAYNPSNAPEVWRQQGVITRTVGNIGLANTITTATDSDGNSCDAQSGIDLATGKVLWSIDSAAVSSDQNGDCTSLRFGSPINSPFDNTSYTPIWNGGDSIVVDITTGAKVAWRGDVNSGMVDPISGYVYDQDDNSSAVIYDPHSGQVKATLPLSTKELESTNTRATSFFGGKLYMQSTSGNFVADAATGQSTNETWKIYPCVLQGNWVLMSNGTYQAKEKFIS